jgi:hypothetical protein
VEVRLTARTEIGGDLDRAAILAYTVRNRGDRMLSRYHLGLFMDWDVVDLLGNVGGTDRAHRAAWVGMPDGPVFGQALLGDAPLSNATVIDNPTYVFPVSHVIDAHKQQLLSGAIAEDAITTPTDLSALVAAGPYDLAPGAQVTVRFVVAAGTGVDDFLQTVAAAGGEAGAPTAVEPDRPQPALATPALAPNHPNPFNPSTSVRFALPTAGPVRLTVYDLSGRRVRTLVDGDLPAGEHVRRWDGRDQRGVAVASGMYVLRLEADGTVRTRKAALIK